MTPSISYARILILPLICAALLGGCGAPSVSPEQRAALEGPARSLEARGQWREAALAWQQAADVAPGDAGASYQLNAAEALLQAGDGVGAASVARALPDSLSDTLSARRSLVLADASLLMNDPAGALDQLRPAVASEDPALISRYRRIRADALELSGDYLAAARELALRDALLSRPEDLYRNRQQLWDLLGRVPEALLLVAPDTAPAVEGGWIELASIARRNRLDVDALDAAVANWSLRYPGHPAGEQIVPELLEQARADAQPPSKVALLLPQSGPFATAAQAVREGFMAAWFADAPNPDRPQVMVRDSTAGDVALSYSQALADGAQFVVGPLAKESVNALLGGADLSVSTIVLNYPSIDPSLLGAPTAAQPVSATPDAAPAATQPVSATPNAAPAATQPVSATSDAAPAATQPVSATSDAAPAAMNENAAPAPRDLQRVYYFSLAPEDEARRAAEYAYARGARQAAILTPEGNWGKRIADAFSERWQELGGVVTESQHFPEEATGLSAAVERLLNIDESESRAKALRATLVRDIKHEPEPRSDLDVIFLTAFPQVARQLRPLLQFHRAGDVPVVASSHVYSGIPDPGADQDIEGVVFGGMPWLLNAEAYTLPQQVARIWPDAAGSLGRLYAFGADAYSLIGRLRELRAGPEGGRFPGLTGTLSMGEAHRLLREPAWAQVRDGVPELIDDKPDVDNSWDLAAR